MMNENDLDAVTPQILVQVTKPMLRLYAQGLHHQAVCRFDVDGRMVCEGHKTVDGKIVPDELWGDR